MSENVKLPRDVAEYHRALRKAFVEGCRWRNYYDGSVPRSSEGRTELFSTWARDAFPITRTVPREPVKLPGNAGTVAPVDGKYVSFLPASYVEGSGAYFDAADLDAMRDLLDNPTRTITE